MLFDNKIKILVVGELCKDKFTYGDVSRICPEAPVPVFNPIEEIINPGMAGNVVENLKDIAPNSEITFWHQKKEIQKERIVDKKSNQMIVRIDSGESFIDRIKLKNIKNQIKDFDIVIVSDYNKGFLTNSDLIEIAKYSKISILDSKRKLDKKVVSSYTFIKINELESKLNSDIISKNVIITLGSKGAIIDNKLFKQKNPKETIDVSGAGDTFTSAFSIMYVITNNIKESIIYANKMAGIVVGKRGVATPYK